MREVILFAMMLAFVAVEFGMFAEIDELKKRLDRYEREDKRMRDDGR